MKDWRWMLLLFVLIVVVLMNPLKLREYHGSRHRSGYYRGGYNEDYNVLPRYFPFPLGYY